MEIWSNTVNPSSGSSIVLEQRHGFLEEQGLNPRDASFEFLDLATSDLGPWMKHMVTTEKWVRGSISVQPVPFSVDVPAQRAFENITMICFRHPSLPAIDRYYLPFPPTSIPNKCFVSLPRRQAAELARQQAEILGVGRAAEPATPEPTIIEEQPSLDQPTVETVPQYIDASDGQFQHRIPYHFQPSKPMNLKGRNPLQMQLRKNNRWF